MKNMNRRNFMKSASLIGMASVVAPCVSYSQSKEIPSGSGGRKKALGEKLYNGIELPRDWPPRNMDPDAFSPMPVPYLSSPPTVIPIDMGRQLFVDNFLIESTDLKRIFHNAKKYHENPIFKPETPLERGSDKYLPSACPKDGGIWWDPSDKIFKMWYEAGWLENVAYATSQDGLRWERPKLDVQSGTNRILPGFTSGSDTFWLDLLTDNPQERFKGFISQEAGRYFVLRRVFPENGYCMTSPDGIHWSGPVPAGKMGDRSTFFYNPFRKKWVYSLRTNTRHGRARRYWEHSDFMRGAAWRDEDAVFWTGADYLDQPDYAIGDKPQLYNLSAVAYESLLLGIHEIHHGPVNSTCMQQGIPKITELKLSFSRDGFHWDRSSRDVFIPATRQKGDWDRGYVQSVGGICTVVGDQLRFYFSGFAGDENRITKLVKFSGTYANGSTGVAVLRRDGFASMTAGPEGGTLTTRPLSFSGKYLFINTDCPKGLLKVEILDGKMAPIAPFTHANCMRVSSDSTIHRVEWESTGDLGSLAGRKVRFRFHLQNGHLYSFWVSPGKSGNSNGYVAAGGPGYDGAMDTIGLPAYQAAENYRRL